MTELVSTQSKLASCERVIDRAMVSYVEAGRALKTIRDENLYQGEYLSFEEYCRERWGWSRQQGYRQIDAAEIYEALSEPDVSPTGDIEPPKSERAVRELVPLKGKPVTLVKVWHKVVERFGPEAGAGQVRAVVAEVLPARRDTGDEDPDPKSVDDAVAALRRLTEKGFDPPVLREALDAIDPPSR